jgi:hypothetical protein
LLKAGAQRAQDLRERLMIRNCIGYELDLELREAIEKQLSPKQATLTGEKTQVEYIVRENAKHLRMKLREEIEKE